MIVINDGVVKSIFNLTNKTNDVYALRSIRQEYIYCFISKCKTSLKIINQFIYTFSLISFNMCICHIVL